jgi:RimJ/RimL family protein N-acetyltransferase
MLDKACPGTMTCMNPDWWPLARLRLLTPDLELRLGTPDDVEALAGLAAAGVHKPHVQPFVVPWTDAPPADRALSTLQFQWRQWGAWTPQHWSLDLVVLREGAVVGTQGVSAKEFAVLREVSTGSWLGLAYQGKGIGTQMRAAVLHLAFECLGALYATSGAFADNHASLAVSRKLGYVDDGIERHVVRGKAVTSRRLRLDRETWQRTRSVPVTAHGVEQCLPMFGLGPGDHDAEPARVG